MSSSDDNVVQLFTKKPEQHTGNSITIEEILAVESIEFMRTYIRHMTIYGQVVIRRSVETDRLEIMEPILY